MIAIVKNVEPGTSIDSVVFTRDMTNLTGRPIEITPHTPRNENSMDFFTGVSGPENKYVFHRDWLSFEPEKPNKTRYQILKEQSKKGASK